MIRTFHVHQWEESFALLSHCSICDSQFVPDRQWETREKAVRCWLFLHLTYHLNIPCGIQLWSCWRRRAPKLKRKICILKLIDYHNCILFADPIYTSIYVSSIPYYLYRISVEGGIVTSVSLFMPLFFGIWIWMHIVVNCPLFTSCILTTKV